MCGWEGGDPQHETGAAARTGLARRPRRRRPSPGAAASAPVRRRRGLLLGHGWRRQGLEGEGPRRQGDGDAEHARFAWLSATTAVESPAGRSLSGDRGPAVSTQPHADYVSGLCAIRDEILASAGADGVLAAMDLRKSLKSIGETDPFEDELLSCCVTPHSVVAGTATGPLLVWSRKDLDKEPSVVASEHDSVEALVAVQDVVLTGTGDGVVRAYEEGEDASLTDIGGIGAHGGFPVEVLAKTSGDELVASLSHDNVVRFFDATNASRCQADAGGGAAPPTTPTTRTSRRRRRRRRQPSSTASPLG